MRLLFVAALENEVEGLLEKAGAEVLYTGIGKVNATYRLTKAIYQARSEGVEKRFAELPSARCGSGDGFEIFGATVGCEIIDMEAFALAKLCLIEKIPFASVKYVTDGSDHKAPNDWAKNIPPAARAFEKFYEILRSRA